MTDQRPSAVPSSSAAEAGGAGPDIDTGAGAAKGDQASGSLVTVVIALVANALIALVKSFVAVITGSAAMVAEAAHSWADTGNEVFLLLAERRAAKPADAAHPLGFGRSAYVWSMVAAFGLFAVGAAVSVLHGIQAWNAPEEEAEYLWAYVVLGISFVLEGVSFWRAFSQVRQGAASRDLGSLEFVSRTSDPTLRAVYVEDAAALVGLLVAAGSLWLHQITGDPRWDAGGSILVGLLLGVVAVFLLSRNMAFLVGEVADPRVRQMVLRWMLDRPEVLAVTYLHLEFVGPGKIQLVGAVDLTGDEAESRVAVLLQNLEDSLMSHPHIAHAVLSLASPGSVPLTVDPEPRR